MTYNHDLARTSYLIIDDYNDAGLFFSSAAYTQAYTRICKKLLPRIMAAFHRS